MLRHIGPLAIIRSEAFKLGWLSLFRLALMVDWFDLLKGYV